MQQHKSYMRPGRGSAPSVIDNPVTCVVLQTDKRHIVSALWIERSALSV